MSDYTSATHSLLSVIRPRRPSIATHASETQIPLSASETLFDEKYGFFKTFPRKLRDQIYDFLYEYADVECDHFVFRAAAPLKVLRLVSRQLKLEYEERCSSGEHPRQLLIKDAVDFRFRKHAWVEFPAIATRATGVTVVISACNSDGSSQHKSIQDRCRAYWANYYQDWIEHLARQLPHLRWVRIYLTLPRHRCANGALSYLRSVPKAPQVVEMKLLQPGCAFVEGGEDESIATWTRQWGIVEDHEAVEKCYLRSLGSKALGIRKAFTFSTGHDSRTI